MAFTSNQSTARRWRGNLIRRIRRIRPGESILKQALFGFDDPQPFDLGKMPPIERGHAAVPLQCGRRHNHVVEANHPGGRFQLRDKEKASVAQHPKK
jgi:hypothetical protein